MNGYGFSIAIAAAIALPLTAAADLFEEFSSGAIDSAKFADAGGGIEVDDITNELVIRSRARSFTQSLSRTQQRYRDSSSTLFQADLKITDYVLGNGDTQIVLAGLGGMYYNAETDASSGTAGEIFASLHLLDLGNGLEVWYFVNAGDADGNFPVVEQGTLDVVNLALDTYYTANIAYDGDHTFVFTFDGVSSGAIDGPEREGGAFFELRRLTTNIAFGEINATLDPNDGGVDDGTVASIEARFDNVVNEDGFVDDFSSGTVDEGTWLDYSEFTRDVDNGTLLLEVTYDDSGGRPHSSLVVGRVDTDYLAATATLLSSSTLNSTTQVQAKVGGTWYNDTYEESDPGNQIEGDIWAAIHLERISGAMRARVYISRSDPDIPVGYTTVHSEVLDGDYEMDVAYELAIERNANSLRFYIDGGEEFSFPVGADDFPVKGGYYKVVRAEIAEDDGEAHARFDDIYTDYVAPVLTLNALNSATDMVALPDDTIVQEGEVVTLTVAIENESTVAAYVWEQTAGEDIVVIDPRPGLAARIVGDDRSLSLTVPNGSDGTLLAFRVTVVDESGTHVSQEFALRVDNSQESTLAVEPDGGGNGGSSGSGSAMSQWLLALLVVALLGRRRSRWLWLRQRGRYTGFGKLARWSSAGLARRLN